MDGIESLFSDPNFEYEDYSEVRRGLTKIVQVTNAGVDTKELFPYVVRCFACKDIPIQKLACWFVLENQDNEDVILLSVSSLCKLTFDANPLVRALGLKTLASLKSSNVLQYIMPALERGLKDNNAYVRRTAVVSCLRLDLPRTALYEYGLVDMLYRMIRDPDCLVQMNCINILNEVQLSDKGVILNQKIAHHLLNNLRNTFPSPALMTTLRVLSNYKPCDNTELLNILNLTDPLLEHVSRAVSVITVQLFIQWLAHLTSLRTDVLKRAQELILRYLSMGNAELCYTILDYIKVMTQNKELCFHPCEEKLFCKYNEPAYVKCRKISVMPNVVTVKNCVTVLEELSTICMEPHIDIAVLALRGVEIICTSNEEINQIYQHKLLDLLKKDTKPITNEILSLLKKTLTKQFVELHVSDVICTIGKSLYQSLNVEGKVSAIWLIGEFGYLSDQSIYFLLDFCDSEQLTDCIVLTELLIASTKLFVNNPPMYQQLLSATLNFGCKHENGFIVEATRYHIKLLCVLGKLHVN